MATREEARAFLTLYPPAAGSHSVKMSRLGQTSVCKLYLFMRLNIYFN